MLTDFDGSTSYAGEDWHAHRPECGAEYVTGPFHDPYVTHCIRVPGHEKEMPHAGAHPLADDTQRVIVMWRGGEAVAGDRVPFRDVQVYGGYGNPPVPETWDRELADLAEREKAYEEELPEMQPGDEYYRDAAGPEDDEAYREWAAAQGC